MGIYIWKTDVNTFIVRFKEFITKKELEYFTKIHGKPVFCKDDISDNNETLKNYYNTYSC